MEDAPWYKPAFERVQAMDHLKRMGMMPGDFIIRDTNKNGGR
jgi:hypothetical protein